MPLEKHTDGSWRDGNGFAAVVMLRHSGLTAEDPPRKMFSFIVDHYKPPVVVYWGADVEATLVDPTYLSTMIDNSYARNLTDDEAATAELDSEIEPQTGDAASGGGQATQPPAPAATTVAKTADAPVAPVAKAATTNQVQAALEQLDAKKKAAAPSSSKK